MKPSRYIVVFLCSALWAIGWTGSGTAPALAQGAQVQAEPAAQDDPSCRERCDAHAAKVFHDCMERGGDEDACKRRSHAALEACMRDCDEPADPPTCEERCEHRAREVEQACRDAGGDPEDCREKYEVEYEKCLEACEPEPGPAPSCEEGCKARRDRAFQECIDRGGSEEACKAAADDVFHSCMAHCDRPDDPPPATCEERCERHANEVGRKCLEDGGTNVECARKRRAALDECLKGCERPVDPAPVTCEARCKRHAEEVEKECIHGGGSAEECAERRKAALDECLKGCERPVDPAPVTCEEACEHRRATFLQSCIESGGRPERCEHEADELFRACLSGCDRPPEPSPCDERCDRYRDAVYRACIAAGLGEDFCKGEADAARERCVRACEHPPLSGPGASCGDRCAELAKAAFHRCMAAGGERAACERRARETQGLCLERCTPLSPGGRRIKP